MSGPSLQVRCVVPATVNIALDSSVLPQLHLPEDIAELFQEAVAEPARRGENDETPAEELGDPVPATVARRDAHQRRLAQTEPPSCAERPRAPAWHGAPSTSSAQAEPPVRAGLCPEPRAHTTARIQ